MEAVPEQVKNTSEPTAVSAIEASSSGLEGSTQPAKEVEVSSVANAGFKASQGGPAVKAPSAAETEVLDLESDLSGADQAREDWREAPIRHVCDMAEDPLEAILLDSLVGMKRTADEYSRMADTVRDFGPRQRYIEFVLKLNAHMLAISDHIRKYRNHGRQEVVVHHQTDSLLRRTQTRAGRERRRASSQDVGKAGVGEPS